MKTIKRLRCLLCIIITAIFTSCDNLGQNNNESTRETVFQDFTLKSNVYYYTANYQDCCTVIDTNTVSIRTDTPEHMIPDIGDIILLPISNNNPDGFLGRIIAINVESNTISVETEPVSLEEVFDEIHINSEINISKYMDVVEDEEGNLIECGILPDDVWSNPQEVLDSLSENAISGRTTKADINSSKTFTRSIPFKTENTSGDLILSASVIIKLDITDGVLKEYDIQIKSNCFIKISSECSVDGEKVYRLLPSKTIRLPFSIPAGPIALRPAVVISTDLITSGAIQLGAEIGVGTAEICTRWHNGETSTKTEESNLNYINAYYLNAHGKIEIDGRFAVQLGVFGQKILAFGIDVIPKFSIGLSGTINMDNTELLKFNPTACLKFEGTYGAYLYSKLFSKSFEKLRCSFDLPERTWELNLLDTGRDLRLKLANNGLIASGEFDGKSMMAIDEKGFALFSDNKPIDWKTSSANSVASKGLKTSLTSVSFPVNGNLDEYQVRPYNKIRDSYFYGSPIEYDIFIDLGLSVDWACQNVGANSPEEFGSYFRWEEDDEYETGRRPTKDEIAELVEKCRWTIKTVNTIYGLQAEGPNGNTIYFPFAGYYDDLSLYTNNGISTRLWGSSLENDESSLLYITFWESDNGERGPFAELRWCEPDIFRYSIRLVRE